MTPSFTPVSRLLIFSIAGPAILLGQSSKTSGNPSETACPVGKNGIRNESANWDGKANPRLTGPMIWALPLDPMTI